MQRHARADGRHFDVGTVNELWICHEHFTVQVLSVALEPRIPLDFEYDEDVPTAPAARPDVADATHRHVLTSRDSRRNLYCHTLFLPNASFPATLSAGR